MFVQAHVTRDCFVCSGNGVGDVCEDDTDGDGTVDRLDNCPKNPNMNVTNFREFKSVNMEPTSSDDDVGWRLLFDGAEIRQAIDTNATALLVGE